MLTQFIIIFFLFRVLEEEENKKLRYKYYSRGFSDGHEFAIERINEALESMNQQDGPNE